MMSSAKVASATEAVTRDSTGTLAGVQRCFAGEFTVLV